MANVKMRKSAHESTSQQSTSCPSQSNLRLSGPVIDKLLLSNHVPSETERRFLSSLSAEVTQKVADLKLEIQSIRSHLNNRIQECALREQQLSNYQRVLSPVRRLPDNVLLGIFSSFINDNFDQDRLVSSADSRTMPWRLAQVCRQWRSVVLSSKRMWSIIRLTPCDFDTRSEVALKTTAFSLELQLHRSGLHPLSVSIASSKHISTTNPILHVLLPSAPRWVLLDIYTPLRSFSALSPIGAYLPFLTKLNICLTPTHLRSGHCPELIKQSALASMFQLCPTLHRLRGHSGILSHCKPWHQITTYESVVGQVSEHLNVLAILPNVKHCTLRTAEDYGTIEPGRQLIILKNLMELSLYCKNRISPILTYLLLPVLHTLKVISDTDSEVPSLQVKGQREFLQVLTLRLPKIKDADCIRILESLPYIQTLCLICPTAYTPMFFEHFSKTDSMLPFLQKLDLYEIDLAVVSPLVGWLKTSRPGLQVATK